MEKYTFSHTVRVKVNRGNLLCQKTQIFILWIKHSKKFIIGKQVFALRFTYKEIRCSILYNTQKPSEITRTPSGKNWLKLCHKLKQQVAIKSSLKAQSVNLWCAYKSLGILLKCRFWFYMVHSALVTSSQTRWCQCCYPVDHTFRSKLRAFKKMSLL